MDDTIERPKVEGVPETHASRRTALRSLLTQADVAALLVTDLLNIPLGGQIRAAGLSQSQLERAIERRLIDEKIFTHPTATINVPNQARFGPATLLKKSQAPSGFVLFSMKPWVMKSGVVLPFAFEIRSRSFQ